jgi:hypothetical protein
MNCSEPKVRPAAATTLAILIAFVMGRAVSGSEPVRLTTDGTLKLAPMFIERGDEIAFASHESPNLVAIVRLRLSDGTRRRVHPTVVNHQFDPAFSGDGRLHAYARSSNGAGNRGHARQEGVRLSTSRIARDGPQPIHRAGRLSRRLQPVGCRRASDQQREFAGAGSQALDRFRRNERLAGLLARFAEDRVRVEQIG